MVINSLTNIIRGYKAYNSKQPTYYSLSELNEMKGEKNKPCLEEYDIQNQKIKLSNNYLLEERKNGEVFHVQFENGGFCALSSVDKLLNSPNGKYIQVDSIKEGDTLIAYINNTIKEIKVVKISKVTHKYYESQQYILKSSQENKAIIIYNGLFLAS